MCYYGHTDRPAKSSRDQGTAKTRLIHVMEGTRIRSTKKMIPPTAQLYANKMEFVPLAHQMCTAGCEKAGLRWDAKQHEQQLEPEVWFRA